MNIILLGPPGAGKGTQANIIAKDFNLHKISTGDLLREEIHNETEIGKNIKTIIDKGNFVSDQIINTLIVRILSNKSFFNRLIFDGYPRNLEQTKNFENFLKESNQKISIVLNLNVDKETIIKRILGRQVCKKCGLIFNKYFNPPSETNHKCGMGFLSKRSDDDEKVISTRYETYLKKTLPILDYYKDKNLLREINGKSDIEEISAKIRDIIASLET